MEEEKNTDFSVGPQPEPKEMDILIFIIISGKSHIRPLSILYVHTFLLFGTKIYSRVVFCLVSALLSQPNLQKLIVNVFTNKKKFHRVKCYNCASEIKL